MIENPTALIRSLRIFFDSLEISTLESENQLCAFPRDKKIKFVFSKGSQGNKIKIFIFVNDEGNDGVQVSGGEENNLTDEISVFKLLSKALIFFKGNWFFALKSKEGKSIKNKK